MEQRLENGSYVFPCAYAPLKGVSLKPSANAAGFANVLTQSTSTNVCGLLSSAQGWRVRAIGGFCKKLSLHKSATPLYTFLFPSVTSQGEPGDERLRKGRHCLRSVAAMALQIRIVKQFGQSCNIKHGSENQRFNLICRKMVSRGGLGAERAARDHHESF